MLIQSLEDAICAPRESISLDDVADMPVETAERIELTHKSSSRATYVQGSLRATRFLATQERGLFDMFDVLSLR